MKANISRWCRDHGSNFASQIFDRSADAFDDFLQSSLFTEKLRKEGEAIQKLLSRPSTMTMNELLKSFSMQELEKDLHAAAPTLWGFLPVSPHAKVQEALEGAKNWYVFTAICTMLSLVRSQRANNFQTIMGLFLLGSGASKREISVLAAAGLSVSPSTVNDHVKQLSQENLEIVQGVIKRFLCSLAWDNLNFAFQV
ncbi:hypothetical protein BDP27DRAFT_1226532, partial [Rhodocollybia butyracea]